MTTFDPRWMTSTVHDMLLQLISHPDMGRLPILADALMDAGCDDEALLAYLRERGLAALDPDGNCLRMRTYHLEPVIEWYIRHHEKTHKRPADAESMLDRLLAWAQPEAAKAMIAVTVAVEAIGSPVTYRDDRRESDPLRFDEIMNGATDYVVDGESIDLGYNFHYQNAFDEYGQSPERAEAARGRREAFWTAFAYLAGVVVDEENRTEFFYCNC